MLREGQPGQGHRERERDTGIREGDRQKRNTKSSYYYLVIIELTIVHMPLP
jgi:hypothetical protein